MRFGLVLLAALSAPLAAGAQDWRQPISPFETQEQTWRRQEAERFRFEQQNRSGLGISRPRLGDPEMPPPTRFDSYGSPRWELQPRRSGDGYRSPLGR